MKMKSWLLAIILSFVMALGMFGIVFADETVSVTGISLNMESAVLKVDQTLTLNAEIIPAEATNQTVIWTSSEETVATVEAGVVTAQGEGTAEITAESEDGGFTAVCTVTVEAPEPETVAVTGISISSEEIELTEGESTELTATVIPEEATNPNIIWSSSDENIVTVDNGVVTAVSEGTAEITVTSEDGGFTAVCTVTVNAEELLSPTSYTIQYELNGGTNASENPDTYTDQSETIVLADAKYTGYTFMGWFTDAEFETQITEIPAGSTGDYVLYAKWSAITFEITYNLSGGSNNAANPATYTALDAVEFKNPTKKGYTFAGWFSDSAYTEKVTNIAKGSTGAVTLYAKWTVNTYTIKFDGKAATSGTMNALTGRKYDTAYTLPANAFKRTGCTFTGWNTKKDGSGTKYANNASVKNLTATNNGTVTLFAQWKKTQYTIKYVLNGGKNNSGNPATYTYFNAVTLKNPTRTGYTFVGWYSDAKLTKKVTGISQGSAGTKTFYARWTINKYTIKLFGNGSTSGSMKLLTNCRYGTAYTLTDNAYKRNGYFFTGWNTKKDGSGTAYKNKASVKNLTTKNGVTVTLYAQWKIRDFTITYNMNGGKNNSRNPATYRITSAAIILATPVKTGYTFGGWYTDKAFTASKKVTQIPKGSYGNKVFYAKWTANKYTIKFNGNGATSGSMSALTGRQYGKAYTLTANAFKKKNCTFVGWNTKKDGSGTTYKNKASVKNLTAKNGGTVTLYAQWRYMVDGPLYSTDEGAVMIFTNYNSYPVSLDAEFVYYDGSTVVDTSDAYCSNLESGKQCALRGWTSSEYTYVEVNYSWTDVSSYMGGNASNITVVSSNWGDDCLIVKVRNDGKTVDDTEVAVVYYKNGSVVGYERAYADVPRKGNVDYLEFSLPYDEDYNTIQPSSYKIFINSSYYYK